MVKDIKNKAGLLDVIKYPCMSFKAKKLNEEMSQIVIFVNINATKIQIKQAVEIIFGMSVEKVNTVVLKGKNKKSARRYSYTESDEKKAIISFKDKDLAKKMSQEGEDNLISNPVLSKE